MPLKNLLFIYDGIVGQKNLNPGKVSTTLKICLSTCVDIGETLKRFQSARKKVIWDLNSEREDLWRLYKPNGFLVDSHLFPVITSSSLELLSSSSCKSFVMTSMISIVCLVVLACTAVSAGPLYPYAAPYYGAYGAYGAYAPYVPRVAPYAAAVPAAVPAAPCSTSSSSCSRSSCSCLSRLLCIRQSC
ncbi:hypothetical protein CEXT_738011 [Caerostris extrusa]|uniref:Uncharacterized protein n=1 Tax=Caerostris extrusa TaxID=172846 RepID=A0AAV4SHK8_CAEEX|nr:hypothetical protein CEXT_738011 [Caerostris extrusa]